MKNWHHPRFSFEKNILISASAYGDVDVVGGLGLPAWEPQEAFLLQAVLCFHGKPHLFSCSCRCSLPLFGLVAAVRFILWHWAGLLFWAGRSMAVRIAGPTVFQILRTWNSCNWSSELHRGSPGQPCAQTPHVGFSPFLPILPTSLSPIFFFFLLKNKSRLQCSWCCSDSTIRCYQCFGSSIRPESKRLSFSSRIPCLWVTLLFGCLKVETVKMPLVCGEEEKHWLENLLECCPWRIVHLVFVCALAKRSGVWAEGYLKVKYLNVSLFFISMSGSILLVSLFFSSDSTYRWYHMIFVFWASPTMSVYGLCN